MSEKPEEITVYDGKYTLIMDPSGLRALRYGEEWRDLVGDFFVMALGYEILELRARVAELESKADEAYEYARQEHRTGEDLV